MLFGHVQVALANTLRGSNLFSDAWLIAMDYRREPSSATGKIFDYNELDKVITRMLRIDRIEHAPA
jgi:D-apionate oxidoisomerase